MINRLLSGTLALTLAWVAASTSQAQYVTPGNWAGPAGPMGQVQLASCPNCAPAPAAMPAPGWVAAPVYADDADGCAGCGGAGCGGAGCGGGGCGLGGGAGLGWGCGGAGLGAGLANLGEQLAGTQDGFNSQCLGQTHGPYGSGGNCIPRWFDVHAEWLYWQRDLSASQVLSSTSILGTPALDTNQLDFQQQSGFRITGAYLVGPSTNLEATYFGTLNWSDSAAATGNNDLYSVIGGFGSTGLDAFPDTGTGYLHTVALSSGLDNGELNLRRRWVSANCLIHSSWLVGVRYLRLQEDMVYSTRGISGQGQPTFTDYRVHTDNDLVGAQIGTDLFLSVTPRFKIGGEVEGGLYGNAAKQKTQIDCTSCGPDPIREGLSNTDAAFVGEAGLMGLYKISPQLTLRSGYQILYVDGVALATDNFNPTTPLPGRNVLLNNNGNVFYHGATVGFEWTW